MTTQKIGLVIGLSTALLMSGHGLAQTFSQTGTSTPVVVPIYNKGDRNKNDRPKAPVRQYIDCVYSDGSLSVSFLYPEGEASMTVTDLSTGFSSQYQFGTSEVAEIYVGILPAAYIYIESSTGHSYEGEFNLTE